MNSICVHTKIYSGFLFPLQQGVKALFVLLLVLLLHTICYSFGNTSGSSPQFNSSQYSFTVAEQSMLSSNVGKVVASDPDNEVIFYTIISGNTNGAFKIDTASGSITIAKRLNHHTQDKYFLIIRASDGELFDETPVAINILSAPILNPFDTVLWNKVASQPFTVSELQGEVVNDKLYTFGGFDSQKSTFTPTSRAYKYDPVTNKWTSIAPMPPMNGTSYGGVTHAGFTTDGTDIFFAGGYTSNATGTGQIFGTKEVWKYIVAQNIYERLPDLPITIAAGQLEYLAGKLHYISGTNASRTTDLGDHYVLDLDSLNAGWKTLAPLPNPRQHAGSVVFENKIYFIGGQHGHDSKLVAQKDVHVYDPSTNTWTKVADLPVPDTAKGRGHISSGVIVLGKYIIVLGGETVHSAVRTNMVSAYEPSTDTWKNLTPLPSTRYSGVAANIKNVMFYTGGSSSKITFKGVPVIQKIEGLTLINADTDQPIQPINNGDTINLATLPTLNLNIKVVTNPGIVGSVKIILSGGQNLNVIQNHNPYSVFGDMNGDYNAWTPMEGVYSLTASPYSDSDAKGTLGVPSTINFTIINVPVQTATLLAKADAFVRNGTYASNNYGKDTSLEIKNAATNFTRYSYLKFVLPPNSGISQARLRVYGSNTSDATTINITAFGANNDNWNENNINWNNAPSLSTGGLSSTAISAKNYYEFDVTSFVKSEQANADSIVTFILKDASGVSKVVVFNSKENKTNPPKLYIQYLPPASRPVNRIISKIADATPFQALGARVFPNPLHGKFSVALNNTKESIYGFAIISTEGKIYTLPNRKMSVGANTFDLDISKLSLKAGVYFLRISAVDKSQVIKIILD